MTVPWLSAVISSNQYSGQNFNADSLLCRTDATCSRSCDGGATELAGRNVKQDDPGFRSWLMSRIRGKNTKPELIVRSYLHGLGIRFRLHVKDLPGKPDIAIKKYRLAIQVKGCFWHGHENCEIYRPPRTNADFWNKKISRNRERDVGNREEIEAMGFTQIDLWECEVKSGRFAGILTEAIKKVDGLKNHLDY